ncbi:baseplate J/gp47 family protein [Haliangium sp.]|uniref:baseplate J/gp47 family protein n=1 Tax=Haliangium sp. TaxID=2663208 RepID=UPI003D135E6A
MGRPYRTYTDGDVIRADDWNEIQSVIKEEIRTHRHGGAAEGEEDPAKLGGLLRTASLRDGAVTAEKIAEDAVSGRALAKGAIQTRHFRPDAAIDERKVLFDPDEPPASAIATVTLAIPEQVREGGGELLWAIPVGTPITNDIGDIVFRTTEPVSLSAEEPTVEVAARCEEIGAVFNVPAGTLTRVGGALDPFLREHLTIAQQAPAAGGLDPAEGQPPQTARAPVAFAISSRAPRTFWFMPKGTRVLQRDPNADPDTAPLAFVTRQMVPVFPGSTWVRAEATVVGEGGNVAAGRLSEVVDAGLAELVTIDQPAAAEGGEADEAATVWLRVRLLRAAAEGGVEVPAGAAVRTSDGIEFRTTDAVTLTAGGVDYAIADPVEATQGAPLPGQPFELADDARPRLEKIFDPELVRHVSVERDLSFEPAPEDVGAIRIRIRVSERAPVSAWQVPAGMRVSTSAQSGEGASETVPMPIFDSQEPVTVLPRSGVVWADASAPGSDLDLPVGSLLQVDETPGDPDLAARLEVYQVRAASGGADGFSAAPVRFRVIEATPLPAGQSTWQVPTGTRVSDGAGNEFRTRETLVIGLGGMAMAPLRAELPGTYGNVATGTLDRVLPDSEVRVGNAVDDTVTPYVSVLQRRDAAGGGETFQRARVDVELSISARAPSTAWLIPRDTRIVRTAGQEPHFETIDALPVLPRTNWVWATPEDPNSEAAPPVGTLRRVPELAPAEAARFEISQPEDAESTEQGVRVRLFFRVIDGAVPDQSNTWTIPAGTVVTDDEELLRFVTSEALIVGLGGVGITLTEAGRTGAAANGVADLVALDNPEDFERLLVVAQGEPAEGGADGGSDGHHHKDEPGALPSHPLADGAVGADQVAEGAVTWPKLSPQLAARLQKVRDQLRAVEDALIEAGALEALMKQRHRSVEG